LRCHQGREFIGVQGDIAAQQADAVVNAPGRIRERVAASPTRSE